MTLFGLDVVPDGTLPESEFVLEDAASYCLTFQSQAGGDNLDRIYRALWEAKSFHHEPTILRVSSRMFPALLSEIERLNLRHGCLTF